MRVSIIFIFIFVFTIYLSQSKQETSDSLSVKTENIAQNTELIELKEENISLNKRIESLESQFSLTLDSISTQLTTSTYILAFFSLLFAFAAVFLTVYINSKSKQIKKHFNEIKDTEKTVTTLKSEIDYDNKALFLRFRQIETDSFVERLCEIPEDISNLHIHLLTRNLNSDHFLKLSKAYENLILHKQEHGNSVETNLKNIYLLVFFQHFLGKCLEHPVLKRDIQTNLKICISDSYYNDVIKSSLDLCSAISVLGFENNKLFLVKYIKSLSESVFSDYGNIYQLIFQKIQDNIFRFEILRLLYEEEIVLAHKYWLSEIEKEIERLETSNLSESQKLILKNSRNLVK